MVETAEKKKTYAIPFLRSMNAHKYRMSFPVFNLDIEITGWDRESSSLGEYENRVSTFNLFREAFPTNENHVMSNGTLKNGYVSGLHLRKTDVDLDDYVTIASGDHMHMDDGRILDYRIINGRLKFGRDALELDSNGGAYKTFNPVKFDYAWYTLEGLYDSLNSDSIEERIIALIEHIRYRDQEFNLENQGGLDTENLRILEDIYRERVSSQ